MYWPVELYSFGKCYRDWLNLPFWAPLPLYGDHGVNVRSGGLAKHEQEAKPETFLTWDKRRVASLRKEAKKKIIHIRHPWVTYRRKHGLKLKKEARGTLIFYSHSNAGIEILDHDWNKYFLELKALPDEFHPLVICMHRHDIQKGYHKTVKKYGLPIISAGETSSPYFVDRFYDMISRFTFATSNSGGSELFYCEEFGVRYFIMGEKPKYFNFTDEQIKKGVMQPENSHAKYLENTKRRLFTQCPPLQSEEKVRFVSETLGLDIDPQVSRNLMQQSLRSEYLRHPSEILINLFLTFCRLYLPLGFLKLVKQFNENRH
jgi:hypothetical protein